MADYSSKLRHDDEVVFTPMFKQAEDMGITQEEMYGKVVAIRFTKAKVFYDILDDYHGVVFKNVDSCNVELQDPKKVY